MIPAEATRRYGVYFSPQHFHVHYPRRHERIKTVTVANRNNDTILLFKIFNRIPKVWIDWVSPNFGVVCLKNTDLPIFYLIRENSSNRWEGKK